MDNTLALVLVEKGVIPQGTGIHAEYETVGLGSVSKIKVKEDFTVVSTKVDTKGRVVFVLADALRGFTVEVLAESVDTIDGMDPVRFASVYGVNASGGKVVEGKRRGRKPKNRTTEAVTVDAFDDEDDDEEYFDDF